VNRRSFLKLCALLPGSIVVPPTLAVLIDADAQFERQLLEAYNNHTHCTWTPGSARCTMMTIPIEH